MSSVLLDKRVEASMSRLRAMGIKFYVDQSDDNTAYIVIDLESVVRLIDRSISYPSHKTSMENNFGEPMMVIKFWRGGDKIGVRTV